MKWTFLAGLGAGAAIGMMWAPKSGAELRSDIQEFARESYDQGRERLQPVVERLQPVVDQAREKLQPAIDNAREQAKPMMDEIRQRVDTVMAQASDVRDRVVEKASEVKDGVTDGGLMAILNDWPHERLIEIDGIGPVLANKIIQHRPYESEEALMASKQLPPSAIESLRKAA